MRFHNILLCVAITWLISSAEAQVQKRGILSSFFGSRGRGGGSGSSFLKDMAVRKGLKYARKYGQRKGGFIGKGIGKAADYYERRRNRKYGGGSSSSRSGSSGLKGYLNKFTGGSKGSSYSNTRGRPSSYSRNPYSGGKSSSGYSNGGSRTYTNYKPSPYSNGGSSSYSNRRPNSYPSGGTSQYSNRRPGSSSRGNNVAWDKVTMGGQGNKNKDEYKQGLSDLSDLMND